jgi:hypothetical protein
MRRITPDKRFAVEHPRIQTYLRNVDDVPLHNLEERVLHALTRDVAADAHVPPALPDLVRLINVHDPALAPLNVLPAFEVQLEQDALHVLAHVPGLGQAGCVGDDEGNINHAGKRLDQ